MAGIFCRYIAMKILLKFTIVFTWANYTLFPYYPLCTYLLNKSTVATLLSVSVVCLCWECDCNWYKKILWSDKHVQIVFVIGNVQLQLHIICQYMCYKWLCSIRNIWKRFAKPWLPTLRAYWGTICSNACGIWGALC